MHESALTRFVIYNFVNGTAFLVAASMLFVAPLLSRWPESRVARIAQLFLVGWGVPIVVVSGTPLPFWLYALWGAGLLAWNVLELRRGHVSASTVWIGRLLAAALALGGMGMELWWQLAPTIPLPESRAVYVIGDSISTGERAKGEQAWPEVMRKFHSSTVNLAVAASRAREALDMAMKIPDANAVVIIEIGGNDLGITPVDEFGTNLEAVIRAASGPQRTLLMFELPSLPFGNRYGMAQRRLASAYGVHMIPRRLLVSVLAAPDATTDGVHLSQRGHNLMAEAVWGLFR